MQTPIRNFEEGKQIGEGASMIPFNVNCYDVIRDLVLEFKNGSSAATLANCLSSVKRIVVMINGMNTIDVKLSQLVDLYKYLGTRVQQQTLTNVFGLNIGRLLYAAGVVKDEFAWRCGRQGNTDPNKKISSLVVQIYMNSTITDITDVNLYSIRKNVEADWNDSYVQFNNNTISFAAAGQSQVNTLPKNANDLFLAAIAYNGGGAIASGETLVNNVNVARSLSLDVNNAMNELDGYGVISGAFVHNYCDGMANSGLFVNDITSELSVRTTFSTAPSSSYDIAVLKVHNCPAVLQSAVNSNTLLSLDTLPR